MWTIAAVIAIIALLMSSIALGRSDGDTTSSSGGSGDSSGNTPTPPAVATGAKIDFQANPATDWKPFDPTLEPAPGGTEHKVTMHASEKVIEVAPGVTQEMWTFDGQVPGTTLRGKVGDLFTITLVNDGKIEHSIDLHASKVAWNVEMRSIKPGESLVYQFKAKFAGAFMYHCGTAPALHHIGNGMYGAIIIDPPVLAPVDHEYLLVQSELYTGPEGQPGDLTKMINEQHDAVVFNGYVSQYKFSPIRVEPDERVRVWVVDAGPSENSSFHIVGTIFDTVFKEGTYSLQPDDRQGGSQALDLQPAQGGFVEFTFDAAGLYPIVTHKFANVGKGALGLFQAGEVAPAGTPTH
jgi:nitrite reductase (NO-forming)